MNNTKIKLEYIPVSEVIPYERNPRKNDKAVEIVSKGYCKHIMAVKVQATEI